MFAMKDGICGVTRMSNSTDKMQVNIEVIPEFGKEWVVVRFANGTKWIPSFEDIYRIVQPMCECEDNKYPPPSYGRWMIANFLMDIVKGKTFEELAEKFSLPIRQGTKVVNSNGAGGTAYFGSTCKPTIEPIIKRTESIRPRQSWNRCLREKKVA